MASASPSMPFSPCESADLANGSCSDVSVGILEWIFGPVIRKLAIGADPDSVDASVNVLASIFSVFNSGLLIIASLIVSYVAIMGVTNTANEGEAMGKNWSTLWTPARIVAGGGVLLPTASGYSFIQLIVMMFALWGVGFANSLFKTGIESGIINGALTSVSAQMGMGEGAKPNPNYPLYDIREFAQDYLAVAWCKRTVNAAYEGFGGSNVNVDMGSEPDLTSDEGGGKKVLHYAALDRNPSTRLSYNPICGAVSIYSYYLTPEIEYDISMESITYSYPSTKANRAAMNAIRAAVRSAKVEALNQVMKDIEQWVGEWPRLYTDPGWDNVKSERFNFIVSQAQNDLVEKLSAQMKADMTLTKIMKKFLDDVTSDGWSMAGGFYQRLGGIREEMSGIYSEKLADVTLPSLGEINRGAHGKLANNSYASVSDSIIRKSASGDAYRAPSDLSYFKKGFFPKDVEDIQIDNMGSLGDGVMNTFVRYLMLKTTQVVIGVDGDVDAISRIKTSGDVFALMHSNVWAAEKYLSLAVSVVRGAAGTASSVSIIGFKLDLDPIAMAIFDWVTFNFLTPLAEMSTWLERLAFYFGIFLPNLPYTIFMIAVVGWVLAVLQSIVAAPLWAVMHMTPDRTFVGSQTQGYLLLLSLFIRPALIIVGLFAAMSIANPVVSYISKAFFLVYEASLASAGVEMDWLIAFLTWKNWLILYGLILLPVVYMIFGLSQSLPDTVLKWIGAGVSSMGETQATDQMRSQSEKYGPGALGGGKKLLGKKPKGDRQAGADEAALVDASGGDADKLLSANPQGVAQGQDGADTGAQMASTDTKSDTNAGTKGAAGVGDSAGSMNPAGSERQGGKNSLAQNSQPANVQAGIIAATGTTTPTTGGNSNDNSGGFEGKKPNTTQTAQVINHGQGKDNGEQST